MRLSDLSLRYVLDAKPLCETLRNAIIQLSGFLLMRAASRDGGFVDFGPVEIARAQFLEAADKLRILRAPREVAHHRFHLEGALAGIERALAEAGSKADPAGDLMFRGVEDAERHLRAAGRATPGFELVDLAQACCAAHPRDGVFEARSAGSQS